jgi:hypothetical protein
MPRGFEAASYWTVREIAAEACKTGGKVRAAAKLLSETMK